METKGKRPKVSVIVLTYNSREYLEDCFGSLEKIDREGLDVEVVAVDNASSDGTADEIRSRWSWVTVIETGENLGFAGGNNVAMRNALDSGADYVYLLNADTEVRPDFLVEAVAVAERDGRLGSVQSLQLLHPDRDLVSSAGNALHFMGLGYCIDYRRPVSDIDTETVREIAYGSGASSLYRADALRQVGLFDDSLFMYHEDLDLAWRMRLAGWRIVLGPKSVVWHKYEFSRSVSKWYYMERNRYIVLLKNLRLWTLLVLLPGLLATEFTVTFAAIRGGWWPKKLMATTYFLRPDAWVKLLAARGQSERLRKVSDREIVRLFAWEIRDQEKASQFVNWIANPVMKVVWPVMRMLIV